MADKGYITSLLNGVDTTIRTKLQSAFDHVLTTYRIGAGPKASNFGWYLYSSTTAATANEEFSIEHGQGLTPTKVIPFLDLEQVNSQVVPLTVSRAPDTRRIYLKSSSTGAVLNVLVEF